MRSCRETIKCFYSFKFCLLGWSGLYIFILRNILSSPIACYKQGQRKQSWFLICVSCEIVYHGMLYKSVTRNYSIFYIPLKYTYLQNPKMIHSNFTYMWAIYILYSVKIVNIMHDGRNFNALHIHVLICLLLAPIDDILLIHFINKCVHTERLFMFIMH